MSILIKILIISIPLLICALVPLFSRIYFYFTEGTLQKKIFLILATSPGYFAFDSPPFIIMSIYAYCLIKKERCAKEIAIKLSCLLLPITVFSFYWYSKYLLSPLALGFLPFINLGILVPVWLVVLIISKYLKGEIYPDWMNKK